MVVQVQLLGEVWAQLGRQRVYFQPDQRFRLLAYLAYQGAWVSRDQLAFLFWADKPQADARRLLRKVIYKVRQFDWLKDLEITQHGLRWKANTDVAAFVQALDEEDIDKALKLYRAKGTKTNAHGGICVLGGSSVIVTNDATEHLLTMNRLVCVWWI